MNAARLKYRFLILIIVGLLVGTPTADAQNKLRKMCDLQSGFNEISGIEYRDAESFFAINDGGNPAELYVLDTQGALLKTYSIDAKNTDWEDISSSKTQVFIGDFGNNGNQRSNLRILILERSKLSEANKTTPQFLYFEFEDQSSFPPKAAKMNFDCEAMAYYKDSLYLFSKNRTNPYNGICKMYVLPAKPGNYKAELRDSIALPGLRKELSWITGADIRYGKLAILSSSDAHIFSINEGVSFKNKHKLLFGHFSQKESICFADSSTFWLADEKFSGLGGPSLHNFTWNTKVGGAQDARKSKFQVWQYEHGLVYTAKGPILSDIKIYNLSGALVHEKKLQAGLSAGKIDLSLLKNGSYYAIIRGDHGFKHVEKFIWQSTTN